MPMPDNFRCLSPENSPEVQKACDLLKPFGITFFMFYSDFGDGSELKCTNRPELAEAFFEREWYNLSTFVHQREALKNGFYWRAAIEHPEIINETATDFNVAHVVTWVSRSEKGLEVIHFGSTVDNMKVVNFYLNHMDLLKRFIRYFKNAMADELDDRSNHYFLPDQILDQSVNNSDLNLSESVIKDFIKATRIRQYRLPAQYHNEYLTAKELDVIQWLPSGLSVAEIADKTFNSPRTIEQHIANVRSKLGLKKRSQLVEFAVKHLMV